jgi:prepilin-type N-terminal cleavage/methylation domain-containing protein
MKLPRYSWNVRNGFTIVELITVIAIILFLTALLMPALRRAVETAKMTKCVSNIRQLGQATLVYAADYNGMPPFGPDYLWKTGYFVARSRDPQNPTYQDGYPKNKWFPEYLNEPAYQTHRGRVEPLMSRVAYCPLGGRYGDQGPSFLTKDNRFFNNPSYGINSSLIQIKWFYGDDNNPGGSNDRYCVPLNQVQYPSQTCLWIEGVRSKLGWPQRMGVSGRHYAQSKIPNRDDPTDSGFPVWESHGKASCIFVDQHVEMLKMRERVPASNDRFWEHTSKISVLREYDTNPYP